ncbi:MAG TPA: FG-GAP-like repeat-containing protein, partial [bacterium]
FIIFQNEGYGVHTPGSCGDVNGDGGNDFVLSARPIYYSEIRIYFGGDDLDSIFDWRYTTNDPNPVGRGLGDVNGDGFSDVMVLLGQNFHPLVFFGGNPMDTIPDLTFYDYTYDNTAAIGDVNADGFSDISILLWPQSMGIGSAIYLGGTDVDTIRDVILLDDWGDPTYTAFVTHGDVNGDGISDLITGDANSAGRASYVYLGGPWFNGVPDARIQGVASYYNWGEEISVGDLNGDGRDEILISSSNYWFEQGLAQLFTGPEGEWIDYGAVVAPGDLSHTPGWYKLAQNYPNPFNSSTSIHFELGKPSTVNLKIYDIQGNEIKQLIVNKEMLPGGYNVSWNSKNEHNQAVSSGIYLLELQVDQYRQMKKMVLVR